MLVHSKKQQGEALEAPKGLALTINRGKQAIIKIGEDVTIHIVWRRQDGRVIISAPKDQNISKQIYPITQEGESNNGNNN